VNFFHIEIVKRDYVVEQARSRIMQALTSVIKSWAGQQSFEKILIARLTDQVEEMAQQGLIILRVHPQQIDSLRKELGDRPTLKVGMPAWRLIRLF